MEYNFNELYIGTNGKLHDLIQRVEDLKAELDAQIELEHRLALAARWSKTNG